MAFKGLSRVTHPYPLARLIEAPFIPAERYNSPFLVELTGFEEVTSNNLSAPFRALHAAREITMARMATHEVEHHNVLHRRQAL